MVIGDSRKNQSLKRGVVEEKEGIGNQDLGFRERGGPDGPALAGQQQGG
jgi:hypothetical protein